MDENLLKYNITLAFYGRKLKRDGLITTYILLINGTAGAQLVGRREEVSCLSKEICDKESLLLWKISGYAPVLGIFYQLLKKNLSRSFV